MIVKHHRLLRQDFRKSYAWFKRNTPSAISNRFHKYYQISIDTLENAPMASRSLSANKYFEEALNDENFRSLKVGKHSDYHLVNYPVGKNHILALIPLVFDSEIVSTLQGRKRTKEANNAKIHK